MNKKRFAFVSAALALATTMSVGSLAACNGDTPKTPETPVHHTMVAADCYSAGNCEYWTKGGKFYSDEACTHEIAEEDTVIAQRNHDFGADATYGKDELGHHWKICAYSDCDGTDAPQDHVFVDGTCVCGATESETPPPITYVITVNASENGTVTADKTEAEEGETVTLTVTPDANYELATLVYHDTEDHDIVGTTFVMPAHAVEVTATFALAEELPDPPTKYAVALDQTENGTVTADKAQAAAGETVTLNVSPADGYHLVSLQYNGTDVAKTGEAYTFVMPEETVTVTATFAAHEFVDGRCECGATNGFENFELAQDTSVELGATRTDTANSFKVSATAPDGQEWRIKVYTVIENIKIGHYYEISYSLKSNTAGDVYIEIANSAYYDQKFTLQEGENTVTFRVAVGSEIYSGATNPALLLGALPAGFEVEITGMTYTELTQDLSPYTLGVIDGRTEGTLTRANDNKEFTISATGDNENWLLKVNHNLSFESGKTYEMTYVFTTDRSGNTKFEANNTTIENEWNWFGEAGVKVITVRFTATDTAVDQYSSYNLGELLGTDGTVNLTFTYIELKEVA